MEHVVFYTDAVGNAAHRRVASLDEGLRLVERLRNDEGVDDVSLFMMSEVPLSFRPYYRVEVPEPGPDSLEPAPPMPAPPMPAPRDEEHEVGEEPVAAHAASGSDDIGFFAN